MSSVMQEFTKGLWKDLPPFRLVLGLCPTLAVTNSANNGLGMGAAVIFVLVLSNMIISMVRGIIPKKVRIACFIVIAASLVVAVELLQINLQVLEHFLLLPSLPCLVSKHECFL